MKAVWSGSSNSPDITYPSFQIVNANRQSGWSIYENATNGFGGKSIPLTENIVITKVTVWLATAPGGATSWTFKMRTNATDTAASIAIAGATTTGTWTGSVACSASDLLCLSATPSGSPASAVSTYWTIEYTTAGNFYLMPSGNNGIASSSGTYYYAPAGFNAAQASPTATNYEAVIPTSLTATRIAVVDDQTTGANYTYTVRNNTTATDSTFSAVVNGLQAISATGSLSFSPGDCMVIKEVRGGGAWAGTRACITIYPGIPGEIIHVYGNPQSPSNSATNYDQPIGAGSNTGSGSWNATESSVYMRVPGSTIKKLYAKVTTAPGGAANYTFTVRSNAAATAVTTTISGSSTTGNDTTHAASHIDGNFVSVSSTPSGTPAAPGGVKFGFVLVIPQPESLFFSMF